MNADWEAYGKYGVSIASPNDHYVGFETGVTWRVGQGGWSIGPSVEVMTQVDHPQNTTGNAGIKIKFQLLPGRGQTQWNVIAPLSFFVITSRDHNAVTETYRRILCWTRHIGEGCLQPGGNHMLAALP